MLCIIVCLFSFPYQLRAFKAGFQLNEYTDWAEAAGGWCMRRRNYRPIENFTPFESPN